MKSEKQLLTLHYYHLIKNTRFYRAFSSLEFAEIALAFPNGFIFKPFGGSCAAFSLPGRRSCGFSCLATFCLSVPVPTSDSRAPQPWLCQAVVWQWSCEAFPGAHDAAAFSLACFLTFPFIRFVCYPRAPCFLLFSACDSDVCCFALICSFHQC